MKPEPTAPILVAALYTFAALPDYRERRQPLLDVCSAHEVRGTLLLAAEGINGTIAGSPLGVRAVLDFLRTDPRLADLEHKEAWAETVPFYRLKVRLKKEIVTMGVPGVDPTTQAGTYVDPSDWNDLIADPEVVVIDARNDYEVAIGTFRGAVDPQTQSFHELPAWLRAQEALRDKPKVAMFCTGGIRCEKSTAFLRAEGFEEVYHLKGGILKYLETVPEAESLWTGECFVFDERVAVGHGLEPGSYELCRACRYPINEADKESDCYEPSVSCPHCYEAQSEDERARFRERHRQVRLAAERGAPHLGPAAQQR